jgi:GTP-binding protein
MNFVDEARFHAASGDGGPGKVAFRREAHVPKGGPSGGDGGAGGDVIFEATRDENTLLALRFKPHVRAGHGEPGGARRKSGADGKDAIVRVPVGTLVKDEAGTVLADLSTDGARWVALPGGMGGRGNAAFATSTRQAPTFAQPGTKGREATFLLELKLLADVGLVGYPNAGKSTLIARLSAARPKIAPYPFTTLEPGLGVVQIPGTYGSFVMADIPGLIEGAADGAGLGHRFLRHVERCRLLLHVVSLDPIDREADGPIADRLAKIGAELMRFDPALAERRRLVLLSKADVVPADEAGSAERDLRALGYDVRVASAATGAGVDPLIFAIADALRAEGSP